jgi:uncharacterized protein YjiS (DUF1127 family)
MRTSPLHAGSTVPYVASRASYAGRSARSAGALVRLSDTLLGWIQRDRDRRALSSLDDRLLRDIGVTRAELEAEARKPFWRS